jgi:hypothetical protein
MSKRKLEAGGKEEQYTPYVRLVLDGHGISL